MRSFVFMANLAAQEASGDPAASSSPERVVHRLKGSTESQTLLFGVVNGPAPLGEVSELGLPTIACIEDETVHPFVSFIHISLPLLEETNNADIECVLDVEYLPMPGEELDEEGAEVALWTVHAAQTLAQALGRGIAQTGLLYPAGQPETHDPFARPFFDAGFSVKHTESQMVTHLPRQSATPLVPAGCSTAVWQDYDIPPQYLDDVLELLTVASVDSVQGELSVEPIIWTAERLAQAHGRLRDRRAHVLLVAVIDDSAQRIVSLTELGRHEAADPEVAEWTLTVTARDYRRRGLATVAKLAALRALEQHWPEVRRAYCSVAHADEGMNAIYAKLKAEGISTSSSLEKSL